MKVTYITTEYENTHGKKPRGTGDWGFTPADSECLDSTMPQDGITWAWGNYTDAKRAVTRLYPEVSEWTVMP